MVISAGVGKTIFHFLSNDNKKTRGAIFKKNWQYNFGVSEK